MTDNPTKTKALELAIQAGGTHEEVVKRAHAYHGFLTGAAAAPAAAANNNNKPAAADKAAADKAADKAAADKAAAGKNAAADPKAGAGAPAAGKTNGATPPKGAAADPKAAAGASKGTTPPKGAANPPSAQSIAADTKAPGGKNTYADVVAMLHKVQNSPAGRPECFKILLEDGGGAKSVRDLKPAHYDAVVEACTNIIADEGEPAGGGAASDEDALGDLDAAAGSPERDEMGLT